MINRRFFTKLIGTILGVGLLVALGFVMSGWFRAMRTAREGTPASPQSSPPVASQTDPTEGWKIASDDRSNITFTFKYHPEWDSPYDYCKVSSKSQSFELPANCIKIVVFTDNLPNENTPPGRSVILTSETQSVISGYKAKRKIFTLPGEGPDTYQVWFYDNDRPFLLWLAWIGGHTDLQRRTDFIRTLDTMVNTLELHRR